MKAGPAYIGILSNEKKLMLKECLEIKPTRTETGLKRKFSLVYCDSVLAVLLFLYTGFSETVPGSGIQNPRNPLGCTAVYKCVSEAQESLLKFVLLEQTNFNYA